MNFQEYLDSIDACKEAREWAKRKTSTQAWNECQRIDWLCWWYWTEGVRDLPAFIKVAKELAFFIQKYKDSADLAALVDVAYYTNVAVAYATVANMYAADAAAYAANAAAYAAADAADTAYSAITNVIYVIERASMIAVISDVDITEMLKIVRSNLKQPWIEPSGDDPAEEDENVT